MVFVGILQNLEVDGRLDLKIIIYQEQFYMYLDQEKAVVGYIKYQMDFIVLVFILNHFIHNQELVMVFQNHLAQDQLILIWM
jgi:hypothetical protein